jgi:pyruvate formate lyase activating enzyme
MTADELVDKVMNYKEYFKDGGGVTFSGGEPLLQGEFLKEVTKKLKILGIHTALDTSGVGNGNYKELLENIDLVILDIKAVSEEKYAELTNFPMAEFNVFLKEAEDKDKWLRQVIIPGYNDTYAYMDELAEYIKKIKNVLKVELLPYHTLALKKYAELNIPYSLKGVPAMDKTECKKLEEYLNDKIKEK